MEEKRDLKSVNKQFLSPQNYFILLLRGKDISETFKILKELLKNIVNNY